MAIQEDRNPAIQGHKRLIQLSGLVLIPVFLLATLVLVALNLPQSYEPPLLLGILNTLFLGVIPLIIACIAMRVYLKSGSVSVFLIGSGVLIFGLGSIVAGWVNPLAGGPNMTVTIHNSCALISSIFLLAGAFTSNFPAKPGMRKGSTATIAAAYTGIVVFISVFCLATLQGMTPPFFVPGSGPTLLRQLVLENAVVFFAISSMLFMFTYRKRKSDFFFWTAIALSLITIGLLAVFLQPSVGSPIGWLGRAAQYLGFVFALYAVLNAGKAAKAKGLTLEDMVADFFGDAGESYRQLVETATDAIVTVDEDDRIILWNSAAERIFGFPRDEAAGSSFTGLAIADESKAVFTREKGAGIDEGGTFPQPVEIVGSRKNGESFPVEITGSRRLQQGRTLCTYIIRDITARKQAEEQVVHIASFPRLTPVLIAEVDDKGSILFENPAMEQSLEMLGEHDPLLFFPEDIRNRLNGTPITTASHETRDITIHDRHFRVMVIFTPEFESVRIYASDITDRRRAEEALKESHENLEVQVRERTAKLADTNRDLLNEIDERKRAENDLKESEEKYRILLDESSDPTFSFYPDGTYRYVNRAFADGVGKPVDAITGRKIWDVFPREEAEQRFSALRTVFSTGESKVIEVRVPRSDGDRYYVTTIVPVKDDAGSVTSVLCTSKDITERKRAEVELRESEELFSTAFYRGPLMLTISEIDSGRCLEVNDTFTRVSGYTKDDAIGKTSIELGWLSPEDRESLIQELNSSGRVVGKELRLMKKNGEPVWSLFFGEIITVSGKKRLLSLAEDITDRKRAEEALRQSEEKFRLISENSPDHNIIQDYNLRYVWVLNPQLGLTSEDMVGKTDYDILSKDDADRLTSIKRQVLETGETIASTIVLVSRQGKTEYFDGVYLPKYNNEGKIDGLMGYFRNITERKQAEMALRESHDRFEATIASLDDAVFLVDPATRLISECNAASTRIFGYSHEEMVGRETCFLHVDRAHVEQFGREAGATYEDPGYFTREFEMRRKDGCVFPTEHFVRPIRDPDGRILYVVSVVRDITVRKRAEEELQHALAEREVLLREVHHRVKNNLAGIISLIGLQIASLSDPSSVSLLRDLETRIRSMALVHESLCRTQDLSQVNIASYTENLTKQLFQVYATGADIPCRIDMGEVTMPIETAIPCGLVMSEVITNSLKYAFPTTFSCQDQRNEPCTITIIMNHEGGYYRLYIEDNGIGIPKGAEADRSQSLGLYLIRLIVEHQLRGTLQVSTAGGTAYTIRFPERKSKGAEFQ